MKRILLAALIGAATVLSAPAQTARPAEPKLQAPDTKAVGAQPDGIPARAKPPQAAPEVRVDWGAFLSGSDLIWNRVPENADDAPFLGNGSLGATLFTHGRGNGLGWEINRQDLTYRGSRYPVGRVELQPLGGAVGGTARLDLWNGEASGVLKTRKGEIRWLSFVAGSPSVLAIEWDKVPGEGTADMAFLPSLALPPAKQFELKHGPGRQGEAYSPDEINPLPVRSDGPGIETTTQRFSGGGAFAVALLRGPSTPLKRRYFAAIGRGATESDALAEAVFAVQRAAAIGFESLESANRAWWHAYYPASFLSVPDPRMQAFYWIQIYKLGAAVRTDGPVLDLMGPWYRETGKPWIEWEPEVVTEYRMMLASGRLPQACTLLSALSRGRNQLVANAPAALRASASALGETSDQGLWAPVDFAGAKDDRAKDLGVLTAVLQVAAEGARYQGDEAAIRDSVVPILRRAISHTLAFVTKGPDGQYHLPATYTPEQGVGADANRDLALLRWGLQVLIEQTQKIAPADPELPKWKDVAAHLPPYWRNGAGLGVARGQPFKGSIAYPSHLEALFPLQLIPADRADGKRLLEASLRTWERNPKAFNAISYAESASMHALLGQGDAAVERIRAALDRFVRPNTFGGEGAPAVAGPFATASAIQDLLIQSTGERVRVFPAVPSNWTEASFANLRARDGLRVSARREKGVTAWVRLDAILQRPFRVQVEDWKKAFVAAGSQGVSLSEMPNRPGEFLVRIPKGGWVVLAPALSVPLPAIQPVELAPGSERPYPDRYR